MDSTLIVSEKEIFDDGAIRQIVIWAVPAPVPPSRHTLKYRLAYVVSGQRVIGFDNERGKGDHFHLRGIETPYRFTNVRTLLADFRRLIERERQPHDQQD